MAHAAHVARIIRHGSNRTPTGQGRSAGVAGASQTLLQVALSSLFLQVFHFEPLLDDKIMLVIFGGILSGISIALALKAGASTGGTDFIALLVSNRTGKTIWGFIFASNCVVLVIFGAMFGWDNAAYAIVFQFLSTKAIDSFYHRYERVTLQVTTRYADEIVTAYVESFQHGISCAEIIGGYSREKMYLLHAVVSTYEAEDVIRLMRTIDPNVVVNIFHTDNFIGGWWHGHVDEPVPTAVPDPDKLPPRSSATRKRGALLQDDGR
ncbi:YitT family protein [Collinsella tanakaei]|nr:YitT family protein [Collinsella tanakaei]MDM8246365.1 YitT family protein [Collinsella tanakaei]